MSKPGGWQVWPGAVHYPDFTHPAARAWWQHHLQQWHRELPFDGLWIDMNEVSNFCTGDVCKVGDAAPTAGPATWLLLDSDPDPIALCWPDWLGRQSFKEKNDYVCET